jgi:hypothetical protein
MKPVFIQFCILCFALLASFSCKNKQTLEEKRKELKTGHLDEKNIYTAAEVGWTAQLPADWQVLTKRENFKLNEKGKEILEEATGSEINNSKLIELVSLRKDVFNIFLSTIEPYDESVDGDYDDHNSAVNELLKKAYIAKKIYTESEIGATKIDGIMFDRLAIRVYSPDKNKIILTQVMFSRLINGYDFAMTVNYNNKNDEQTLMDIVNSSKFSIR